MKSILTLFTLITISINLIACSYANSNPLQHASQSDYQKDTAPSGETPLLTCSNYDDYRKFINSNKLPSDFIDYDALATVGEFVSFVCLTDARQNDYGQYMYTLTDQNNYSLTLYIDHRTSNTGEVGPNGIAQKELSIGKTSDFRYYPNNETGTATKDGLKYTYLNGKLLSVTWQNNNATFTLCSDTVLSDYPSNPPNDTFTNQILIGKATVSDIQKAQ